MAPAADPNELVQCVWSGPFVAETPTGTYNVGDLIMVPRHQAEANPHHFRPPGLERATADEVEAAVAKERQREPTKEELLARAAELGIDVPKSKSKPEIAQAIADAEASIAAGGPPTPEGIS